MRVAFLAGSFPLVSETFVVRQVADLLDLGHDVRVFAGERPPPGTPPHPEVDRHRLLARTVYVDMPEASRYELPVRPLRGRTWVPGAERPEWNLARAARAAPVVARTALVAPRLTAEVLSPSRWGYEAESLSAVHRLHAMVRSRERFDVAHAHFGPVANAFRFVRALLSVPLVASFHGYDFSTWPRRHGPRVYERLFAVADAVTVNSAYTRGRVLALGCPAEKLHVLPMGVDADALCPPVPREPRHAGVRVVTVARLVEIKGVEYVLRAFARLRAEDAGARCDIIGDGPLRAPLERLAGELGVDDAVTFHGAASPDDVRRVLWDADVFVLASVTVDGDQEGQGVALLEAQAAGLPVVATDHGGLPDSVLPGTSGELVAERDVDALHAALLSLAGDPSRRAQMGAAGRRFVAERFDHRRLARDLAALYARLAG